MVAGDARVASVVCASRSVEDGRERGARGAFLPELLHRIDNPQPISDTVHAHLLQSHLIQLEQHIPSDVVGSECLGMVSTLDFGKPERDVRVSP